MFNNMIISLHFSLDMLGLNEKVIGEQHYKPGLDSFKSMN